MRKQYHFWPGERGLDAWDVHRLVELSSELTPEPVAVVDLPDVDRPYWFDRAPTVREVVEHASLILQADLAHPIILAADGRVMDGMHRVARALLEGRGTLPAVRFPETPAPDHRDCHPDDLPY